MRYLRYGDPAEIDETLVRHFLRLAIANQAR
jgi:hypothetical protein